ncbi:MAG: hypothetical protein WBC63_08830, partial [Candidatus Bipolaricaulia bacterium]
ARSTIERLEGWRRLLDQGSSSLTGAVESLTTDRASEGILSRIPLSRLGDPECRPVFTDPWRELIAGGCVDSVFGRSAPQGVLLGRRA